MIGADSALSRSGRLSVSVATPSAIVSMSSWFMPLLLQASSHDATPVLFLTLPLVGRVDASEASGGVGVARLSAIAPPPPLTPPHKGEGNAPPVWRAMRKPQFAGFFTIG